jgi:DNA-binding PucR family transcriptional regulator
MQLHRNTVKYRVTKALELVATPATSNRIDLAVALNVCHFLGPSILNAAAR